MRYINCVCVCALSDSLSLILIFALFCHCSFENEQFGPRAEALRLHPLRDSAAAVQHQQ